MMQLCFHVAIWIMFIVHTPMPTSCSGTVRATPYEALPFPEGFYCQDEGVFAHQINCEQHWFCQRDKSGQFIFQPAKLYQCPEGYLFDTTIKFCNKKEQVVCSTMSKKDISEALQIMEEARKLELKLKKFENRLNDIRGNTKLI